MPISDVQADILRRIAANRSPDSYLAGATVLHRAEKSPRYSQDLDFFHDVEESVAQSAAADAETLLGAGYDFEWIMRTPTFHRAVVTAGGQQCKLEWAQDSAFRFFPIQKDPQYGYRLHDADAATNKLLALAGRVEVRDFVDVLHLHESYLSLGAMVWAACGKDPGFTPEFLLDHAGRHTVYTQQDVDRLIVREPLDIGTLKMKWFTAVDSARALTASLPPEDLGCLYLDKNNHPVTPVPGSDIFTKLVRHKGTTRGAWPTISTYHAGPERG